MDHTLFMRSILVSLQDEYESVMTLKIDQVDEKHFTTYFFEAENKLGKVVHEVTLSPGEFKLALFPCTGTLDRSPPFHAPGRH